MDAKSFAKPWVPALKPYVPGETHEGCIKLASNENNYGPSPKAIRAVREAADGVFTYPYKDEVLREKIAVYAGVGAENIVCGNGSDELIEMIVKAFEGPNAGFTPSFSEYRIISETLGVDYTEVSLSGDFVFDAGRFIAETKGARLVFLATPNNPTGGVISREDVEKILAGEKIVVVDEAYFEFSRETVADLINDHPNLIVLRTFSKAFGLGGLRVGYAISGEEIIGLLDRVRPPFNVNALAHEAALASLDDVDYMRKNAAKIVADREKYGGIIAGKIRVFPSKANFWLADVSPMSAQDFFDGMLAEKIVVRKFGGFEGFKGEFVRITVGKTSENEKLVETLNEIV